MRHPVRTVLLALATVAPLTAFALSGASASPVSPSSPDTSRQQAFASAAQRYGVPADVLLGVSYLESRWDDHGGRPSTAGGYGPMHLTDVKLPDADADRADGVHAVHASDPSLHTARAAAKLTGVDVATVEDDPTANIRGGAALLASYQRALHQPVGGTTDPGSWYGAVARYSGASVDSTARSFANEVFAKVRDGVARTTTDGQQVRLAADQGVRPATGQADRLDLTKAPSGDSVECPKSLGCLWIPAPYQQYGPNPGDYGNHDQANRPASPTIDYIVIHDTEETWDNTLKLVQDPTYLGWNYTVRSSDGQVAEHMKAKDIGWQAGNWYINMHSIGVEHEGFEADGSWFTEAMYENSSALVRYLAHRYGIPLDRQHIIGHDQVPAINAAGVAAMHHDPGPFWDWEHYFQLLHAPIAPGASDPHGGVVTIRPGFDDNVQPVTGCGSDPNAPCAEQGTNVVYLHTAPSRDAPLVNDLGLRPDGSPDTTNVSDVGARAAAGEVYGYAGSDGDWTAVWYLGAKAWFYDPKAHPTAVRSAGLVATPKPGKDSIPFYGRAFPEQSAYPPDIPYQTVTPLQYSLKAGQTTPVAGFPKTDYYYAVAFDVPGRDVVGTDRYYWVQVGHRMGFVRAADVDLKQAVTR
ncbi:MAG: N-acetylmuramoyl-L-alanine amidase [Streptosporangiales bacterium]|nr:N-acetylmuramoyl-L-alanine amidase [Streptosporangiales bacterium]MBO0892337.1 N-acetylmuramoyl-L-alanine amidase [Acidothermales bacterium]